MSSEAEGISAIGFFFFFCCRTVAVFGGSRFVEWDFRDLREGGRVAWKTVTYTLQQKEVPDTFNFSQLADTAVVIGFLEDPFVAEEGEEGNTLSKIRVAIAFSCVNSINISGWFEEWFAVHKGSLHVDLGSFLVFLFGACKEEMFALTKQKKKRKQKRKKDQTYTFGQKHENWVFFWREDEEKKKERRKVVMKNIIPLLLRHNNNN